MGRTSDADERLMAAALDLIWEESYGGVTIDDICKRADVKKGSFYYFFESKAHLTVAALERLWRDDWKPKMDACFSPEVDPLERLLTYLDGIHLKHATSFARTGKVLGCPACSVGSEVCTQEIDVSAKVREIVGRKRRYFESAIREAMAQGTIAQGDPVAKALAFACFIEGAVSQARILNDPEVLKSLRGPALALLEAKQSPAAAAAPAVTR
ncbi:TetR/AcrR family transcriptional regulator [Opitutus sp. ER46]|uniref:TetR/AcrR family transcriptional regulator n=1 Tax=Opitutus sp. ER46 TaxID=2161864 RepID=UPI000D3284C9|nr:TetR/AcrR family transcriptional regulator [Opitutus sp. ER46]PTX90776.1 TetR/AcrR family transcriptional regulator [Opitutus sp. ER46]